MYRINKATNNISKLEERLFSDLKFREREHLQEWIAKNPEILGEDLLIIQKEYSGFDDTNERLDLLAVDKDGNLVIIENKLDDTGRNVVWQALKYASYCSTFTTKNIIDIYQKFLDSNGVSENAKDNLMEFLSVEEEELLLNSEDQRIFFVANHFRKEVTSTVLWLLNKDVQFKCFRATPYSMGEELFLQVDQIIPLPETEEFMIHVKEKEKEESSKSKAVEKSKAKLIEFWAKLKENLSKHQIDLFDRVSAKPYYDMGFLKGPGRYAFCLGKQGIRVELYFGSDEDKRLFDLMKAHENEIKEPIRQKLVWERLDNRKASRIKLEIDYADVKEEEGVFVAGANWEPYIRWYRENMVQFYNAIHPVWEKVQKEI